MTLLAVLACSRPPDPSEPVPTCGTADEVCAAIATGDWEITLPVMDTIERTGWEAGCITSEEEGPLYGSMGYNSVPRPGYWFDYYAAEGGEAAVRVPDCAFVTNTRFPDFLHMDAGEVSGLPVAWEFTADTTQVKVEELLLAVEFSWHFREGVGETGRGDYLYDWHMTPDEAGLPQWTFCRVFADAFVQFPALTCHTYVYDADRQVLGGEVTTGEQLTCTIE